MYICKYKIYIFYKTIFIFVTVSGLLMAISIPDSDKVYFYNIFRYLSTTIANITCELNLNCMIADFIKFNVRQILRQTPSRF